MGRDGYTFYDFSKGKETWHAVSLLNSMLIKNNSAPLTASSQPTCELATALRYREIKSQSRSKGEFNFLPVRFGGPGLKMPNADLLLTVRQDYLSNLPKPISKEEIALAITTMKKQWMVRKQDALSLPEGDDLHVNLSTCVYAISRRVALTLM